jgi:hypothetical protein
MKRFAIAALVAAGIPLAAVPAAAQQDEWLRQVATYIHAGSEAFEQRGYRMVEDIQAGSLGESATEAFTVTLSGGSDYFFFGACDNDCSDLDLTLFDAAGNQVATDIETDDTPVVHVAPSRNGTYRVRITMASCSAEPCRYGVGIFGK